MVKNDSRYSHLWRYVKYAPKISATPSPQTTPLLSSARSLWWAQVTATAEARRTTVLSSGVEKASRPTIPTGGQEDPRSTAGLRALWKNPQKNAKKKQASDTINRIMPSRRPLTTTSVCEPWSVLSRDTSRHHAITVKDTTSSPTSTRVGRNPCSQEAVPTVINRAPKQAVKGQGLKSTK